MNLPMENRVSRLEGAYEQVSDRLNAMDGNIQGLRDEIGQNFRWIMGAIGGSWLTIMIALLLHK